MRSILRWSLVWFCLQVPLAWADSASAEAAAYFDALRQKDYARAAAHFDPAALREFSETTSFVKDLPPALQRDFLMAFFGPSATLASVDALSDAERFAAFLRVVMESAPGVVFHGVTVIGEVPEGEELRHVVTRSRVSASGIDLDAVEVISFRQSDGKWRVLMSGKMKGLAAQVRAAFPRPPAGR